MSTNTPLIALALGWLGYFLLHSLLASLAVKQWVERHRPDWMPAYRLIFNATAVLLVLPLIWYTYTIPSTPLWYWSGPWRWLMDGLAIVALLGFLWTSRYYQSGEFIGTRQWRERETRVEDQEHLQLSPAHRRVRHPWYFFGLVLMWTRDMNTAMLVTVGMASLYFLLGSRLEEKKLLRYHGEAYARYRRQVPGLVPLPGRRLSAKTAAELEQLAASQSSDNAPTSPNE